MRVTIVVLLLLLGTFLWVGNPSRAQSSQTTAKQLSVQITPSEVLAGSQCAVGQQVSFHVFGDVKDRSGTVVIPDGSRVQCYVIEARGPRGFGRGGVLRVACGYIELADGIHIPTRFNLVTEGPSDRFVAEVAPFYAAGIVTGAVIVGGFLLDFQHPSSALPLYLFILPALVLAKQAYQLIGNLFHGKDAVTKPGDLYVGTIDWPVGDVAQQAAKG